MSRKRHKPEEIVSKLRQVDVLVAQGTPVADAVRSIGVTEVSCDRKLATALQYSPAACVSGLPTAGPGGVRARLRGLAGCAIPTSFAGQKPRSAKTNPALTFTPDHTIGADQYRVGPPRPRKRPVPPGLPFGTLSNLDFPSEYPQYHRYPPAEGMPLTNYRETP